MLELDKIYNEDCIEGMKSIPDGSIDCVITDPPYELDITGRGRSALAKRARALKNSVAFISGGFDYDAVFNEFLRVCKIPNILIFCSNKQISKIMSFFEKRKLCVTLLVWQKTNPMPTGFNAYISDVEFAVYVKGKGAFFDGTLPINYKKKVYTSPLVNEGKLHPTQKSVKHIMQYIMLHCPENGIVLDAFMGSGTTAIAALRSNRHFVGFEISEKYYNIAQQRIHNELAQTKLF